MKILAIDDDKSILRQLQFQLENRQRWDVQVAESYEEGLKKILAGQFDVIICDYRLSPYKDQGKQGTDIIRYVRAQRITTPVIMITARLIDEITPWDTLEMGGDDFLKKPYRMEELIARVKLANRRSFNCEGNASNIVWHGDISLDLDKHMLITREQQIHLGHTLFPLVKLFFEKPQILLQYDAIIQRVWGEKASQNMEKYKNSLRVNIAKLKSLLGRELSKDHLTTVYGQGYIWN